MVLVRKEAELCLRAARVAGLYLLDLLLRQRQRIAAVVGLAHEVPLWLRLHVAVEAVAAECIDDVGGAARVDGRAAGRGREREELPVL